MSHPTDRCGGSLAVEPAGAAEGEGRETPRPQPAKRRTMIKLALSTLMAEPVNIWVDITGGRAAIGDAAAKALGLPASGLKLVAGGHELSTPEGLAAALRTRQIRAVPRQMAAPIGRPADATAVVVRPDDIKAFFDSLGSEAPAAFDLAAATAARGAAGRPETSSAPDSGAQRPVPMAPPGADAPVQARRRYAEMYDRQKAAAAAAATARGENIQMRRRIEALRDRKDARRAARARKRAGAKAVRRGASSPAAPPAAGFAGFAPGFLEVKQKAKAPSVKTALGPAKTNAGTFAGLRAGFLN